MSLMREEIVRLAGHHQTSTTELVYSHELRPVITTGATRENRPQTKTLIGAQFGNARVSSDSAAP